MKAFDLTCNGYKSFILIDNQSPIFGWKLPMEEIGVQTAYQIQVYDEEAADGEPVWDSGKIMGDSSIQNKADGLELKSLSVYWWRVKYWNFRKEECQWSDMQQIETGMMGNAWKAKWIGYDKNIGESYHPERPFYCADDFEKGENIYYLPPVPFLRYEFQVNKPIKRARAFISAMGLLEMQINGEKVGTDCFVPGLSDYRHRVYYRAYDVTSQLRHGRNAAGIILADGWYAGYMGLNSREWYGSKPRAMAQIEICFADGTTQTVTTNEDWKAAYGPLLESDIFQGETYDANKELEGFASAGYNAGSWESVETGSEKTAENLPVLHPGPPVVEQERIQPVAEFKNRDGSLILDFGTCITGVLNLKLSGPEGGQVTILHAERLDQNGELYLRGNRSARCRDTYILKGIGQELFMPKFTYHGFRFAELKWSQGIRIEAVDAVRISTRILQLTTFECSNDTINKVFNIIRNTQLGNEFEVPTDCCARDERLGWGTEGNHFSYAMCYFSNQENFIRKWVTDIWDGQREDGGLEAIAPSVLMQDIEQFVGDLQSNHGIHMLYSLYKMYGDIHTFRRYQTQVEKYFGFLEKNSDRNIRFATGCDWLGILEETDHSDFLHGYGDSSPGIIGTAHYAIAVLMMKELLNAAGEHERAQYYQNKYDNIKNAFYLNFIQRDGMIRRGKQADYVMALAAGLIPAVYEEKALEHLISELMKDGYLRWKGGTASSPYFLYVLKKYGQTCLANQFLSSVRYPSIGYMIEKGATAVWERWDAVFEDGTLHPQSMNAFNHIGFTTVGEYIISGLAGIDTEEAGFKKIRIQPGPSPEVTWAEAELESGYGKVAVRWDWHGDYFRLKCSIPSNTAACVRIPSDNGIICHEVLSGSYEFESVLTQKNRTP